jgi:hypothetical protein
MIRKAAKVRFFLRSEAAATAPFHFSPCLCASVAELPIQGNGAVAAIQHKVGLQLHCSHNKCKSGDENKFPFWRNVKPAE